MTHFWSKLTLLLVAACTASGCFCLPNKHNLPPAKMLSEPGPGVGGPGPGVISGLPGGMYDPYAFGAARTSQVYFVGPEGAQLSWETGMGAGFDSEPLITPGRQNFPQGAIYRLKLTKIPGRQGVELYPTIEVAPENPRTEAFLAHNPIPIQFTEEDLEQIASSNFVTKVIYVPDPDFAQGAVAGVDTVISTRLNPGVDPIEEADRRGSILAILRIGNIDLEVPSADGGVGGVTQASYMSRPGQMVPVGYPGGYGGAIPSAPSMLGQGPMPMMQHPVVGVNVPEWGMTTCGTPIGLAGPPHIPLGVPAGLQRHSITNKTHMHLPEPVESMKYTVKQSPGFSYPKPPSHVHIHEKSYAPGMNFHNPFWNRLQQAPTDPSAGCVGASAECSDCE